MIIVLIVGSAAWLYIAVRSAINAVRIARPRAQSGDRFGTVLLICDDSTHLQRILPVLQTECELVIVGAISSEAQQAAASLGATAVAISEEYGSKLAAVAAESSPSEWWILLGPDAVPQAGFGGLLRDLADSSGRRVARIQGIAPPERRGFVLDLLRLANAWFDFGLEKPRHPGISLTMLRADRYFSAATEMGEGAVPSELASVGAAFRRMGLSQAEEWALLRDRTNIPLGWEVFAGVLILLLAGVPALGMGTSFFVFSLAMMLVSGASVALITDKRLLPFAILLPISLVAAGFARFARAVRKVAPQRENPTG